MPDDLDAFLRQAAQRRQKKPPAPPRPQPARPQPPLQREPDLIIYEAESVDDGPLDERVSDHVDQHLAPGVHSERLSHFGESVGQADEKMESHLHQVFDHKLGDLGHESVTDDAYEQSLDNVYARKTEDAYAKDAHASKGPVFRPGEIAEMLKNPRSIAQAFVFSEILRRRF